MENVPAHFSLPLSLYHYLYYEVTFEKPKPIYLEGLEPGNKEAEQSF